jgi:hypothetical protein
MTMTDVKPSILTAAFADWQALQSALETLAPQLGTYWAILESPFDITFEQNRLKYPESAEYTNRGRVFGKDAEIRFRRDTSLPGAEYQAVIITDADADAKFANLTLSGTNWQPYEPEETEGWTKSDFQQALWGSPLEKENVWYTSRIPRKLEYPDITPAKDTFPALTCVSYKLWGRIEYYRFTGVVTLPIQRETVTNES